MNKIRILQVISELRTGGAESLVANFAPILKKRDYEVAVAVFSNENTNFRKILEQEGIKIIDILPNITNMYYPGRIPVLRNVIKDYDVIHSHTSPAQYITALASLCLKKALVTTEHSTNNRRRGKPYLQLLERFIYGKYSQIIGCSEDASAALQLHLGSKFENICTIQNGVNVTKFKNAHASSELADNSVIMVGRFIHPKDQMTVVRAIKRLEDTHVYFAGDGPNKTACENLAKELNIVNRCHFLGNRSDVAELLKAAKIAVHSSYWEGLPLSIVEAMASSCAVVASNANGIRDVVEGAGAFFECGNDEQLSEILHKLLSDKELYQQMLSSCEQRATEYDINKMVDSYCRIYNSLTHD